MTTWPPRPASIIGGTKHSRTLIGPIRLTSIIFCQSLWRRRSIVPQVEIPAMFITTSMLPCVAVDSRGEGDDRVVVGDVGDRRRSRPGRPRRSISATTSSSSAGCR